MMREAPRVKSAWTFIGGRCGSAQVVDCSRRTNQNRGERARQRLTRKRTPPVTPARRYDRFCANFPLGRLSACSATGRTLLERQQATVHLVDDLGVAYPHLSTVPRMMSTTIHRRAV